MAEKKTLSERYREEFEQLLSKFNIPTNKNKGKKKEFEWKEKHIRYVLWGMAVIAAMILFSGSTVLAIILLSIIYITVKVMWEL